eukprot:GHVU01062165.1.p1 GENE.GHVU01062165.1~~GHVU01062165.1.p1  ORF type:complete len:212 (+),score=38.52 GHVU01062165.1:752-1387(+)
MMLMKHESSRGRIPTSKGYKYYTNHLMTNDESKIEEIKLKMRKIFDDRSQSIVEIIQKTCNLISEESELTAIVKEGNFLDSVFLEDIIVRKIEDNKINVIFIYSNGEVKNKILDQEEFVNTDLSVVLEIFSERLKGTAICDLKIKANAMKSILAKEVMGLEENFALLINKLFQNIMLSMTSAGISNVIKNNDIGTYEKIEHLLKMIEEKTI